MKNKVLDFIRKNKMIEEGDKIVVGVSGGADSVCLLLLLNEIKSELHFEIEVVHVNHGLRGTEADSDMKFVKEICEELNIQYHLFKYDVALLARNTKNSIEEEGRNLRYSCFEKVCSDTKSNKIAVAHNMNDSVETIILSLARGTGLKGLCGIPFKRDKIIRPLLICKRLEIEKYLEQKGRYYRTDKTNFEEVYSRNKVRLNIIPELEVINNKAVEHIYKSGNIIKETESYICEQTEKKYIKAVKKEKEKTIIFLDEIQKEHPLIIKRIVTKCIHEIIHNLKDITEKHIISVFELINSETGKHIDLPYNLVAKKQYDLLIIEKKKIKEEYNQIEIDLSDLNSIENTREIVYKENKLLFTLKEDRHFEIEEKLYTKYFDYDKIKDSFLFRNRNKGDFINLKEGTKKIKDYFIDQKIPREEREKIFLLAKENKVIWIIGYRINEEYKVSENTKKILIVEFFGGSNGKQN